MPQINDTTGNVKTSTVVRFDAKAEGFERISIPRGTVDIDEGGLMVRDSDGNAAKPDANSRQVYINFSNPKAPQTKDQQSIHVAGQGATLSVELSSGGYAGVNGSGLRVGLPFTDQFFVASSIASITADGPQTRLTIAREQDADAARTDEFKLAYPGGGSGTLIASPTADESNLCFGVVEYIDNDLLWFTFDSIGRRN